MGIISKLRQSLANNIAPQTEQQKQDKLFNDIVGYDDVKAAINMAVAAKEPVHILLSGPPSTGKTQFLQILLQKHKKESVYILGAHSTKAGLVNQLFEKRPKYLLIDEIEYLSKDDQAALLSLMQNQILSETKIKKTRQTTLKTWVFTTCNNSKKLSDALLSRFVVINIDKYTRDEFIDVSTQVLENQENINPDMARLIAESVYTSTASIRDCIKIARMAKNENDVERLVRLMNKK